MTRRIQPEPWGRTIATVLVACGAVLTTDLLALVILWLSCVIILGVQGELRTCGRFLLRMWLPLAAGLTIVWGLAVRGTPTVPAGSNMAAGFHYAALVSLRLAALAGLFQASFVSLRGLRLAEHWSRLGLPPSSVAGLVSIFQLWPDFARRTDQVVAARCARGLMTDRKLITRIKQLPFTFRTLFLSTLGSSLERAARWQAEKLPERLVIAARSRGKCGSPSGTALWVTMAIAWTVLALRHNPLLNR